MNKIFHIKGEETVFYDFWVRADNPLDAMACVECLDSATLSKNITDSYDFNIELVDVCEELELAKYVRDHLVIDAKEILEEE